MKSELPIINDIRVPRWLGINETTEVELHGFCDASLAGIGAVIYLRFIDNNGEITISLLTSKTRVAPLREIKIPRLELLAADLLSKLTKKILKTMKIEFKKIVLWSDSKIVLAWIHGNPKRWKTFVANKVTQINKKVNSSNWFHVPGRENPADCASRGLLPSELLNHNLWWHGPQFLLNKKYELPSENIFDTNEEIKISSLLATQIVESVPITKTIHNLKKIFVHVNRFIHNCKQKVNKLPTTQFGETTLEEMQLAEKTIVKIVQNDYFADEINDLKKNKDVKRSSSVIKLCAFLDSDGILRVGGRLKNAVGLSYDEKHPILLPHASHVSKLIIREKHYYTYHAGPKLLEATIRRSYWITRCMTTIASVIRQCELCALYRPKLRVQRMGDLPTARVTEPKKPFNSCAIDFAGPIQTKTSKLRNAKIVKSYIVIFVCLATKALHIDTVSDLTAVAFVAALRRFVSRRGTVEHIYSDNGTNFTKSNKILQDLSKTEAEQFNKILNDESLERKITWHFSPPRSAHFNGLVEAAVKSTKYHLNRALKYATLTFEELSTVLSQIEAILNSRPLCELSTDPNDITAITPAHFLNIPSTTPVPDEDMSEYRANHLSRWQMVQKISQNFWSKWKNEYLHQLQTRAKWHTKNNEPNLGDLVLLKDDNLPSQCWPMGRITEKHPGNDGITRVVSVKTAKNTFKRGITEIAPLPVTNDGEKIQLTSNLCETKRKIASVRKIRKNKSKIFGILPIFITLLAIYPTLTINANSLSAFSVTKFAESPGLYFEQTSTVQISQTNWRTIVFVDLHAFSNDKTSIGINFENMKSICKNKLNNDICLNTCNLIQARISQVNEKSELMAAIQRPRQKRAAFEFVGDVANVLFGVLGQNFAREYTSNTHKLLSNQEHLLTLVKNHTSILEATNNILQTQDNQIIMQNKQINELSDLIKGNMDIQSANIVFQAISIHLLETITRHENQLEILLNVILDARKNQVHYNLLTPSQMKAQTQLIAESAPNHLTTPNLDMIYKVLQVIPFITNENIFFQVTIPLISQSHFQLFSIIPVPFLNEKLPVQLNSEHKHLITSADRQFYQFMSDDELEACRTISKKHLLCFTPKLWKSDQFSTCEWNLFSHTSQAGCEVVSTTVVEWWKEMGESNKWIFFLSTLNHLTATCGDSVSHHTLNDSGILTLNANCAIKTKFNKIEPQLNLEIVENEFFFPHFNVNSIFSNKPATTQNEKLNYFRANFSKLDKMISEVREQQELNDTVNVHDIHHYIMQYILMFLIFSIIGTLVFIYKKKLNRPIPAPRAVRTISMPNIRDI